MDKLPKQYLPLMVELGADWRETGNYTVHLQMITQLKNTALSMPGMVNLQTAEQMRGFGKMYTN